jgi:hypothetical protein
VLRRMTMTGRGRVGGEEVLTSNFRKNRAAKSFLKFYDDDEKENAILDRE